MPQVVSHGKPMGFSLERTGDNLDAVVRKTLQAAARNTLIRITHAIDNPRNAGFDNRVGAGRRVSPVGAWFKRGVERCAARGGPGSCQSNSFSMGPPAGTGPAKTYDMTTLAEFILLFQKVLPDMDKWYYKSVEGEEWSSELKIELNQEMQLARVPWLIRKYYGF